LWEALLKERGNALGALIIFPIQESLYNVTKEGLKSTVVEVESKMMMVEFVDELTTLYEKLFLKKSETILIRP
jgi:ATP-dependent RNA circularization protein (DNA/RNA ligase family)